MGKPMFIALFREDLENFSYIILSDYSFLIFHNPCNVSVPVNSLLEMVEAIEAHKCDRRRVISLIEG